MPTSNYDIRDNIDDLKAVITGILDDLKGHQLINWSRKNESGKDLIEVEYKDVVRGGSGNSDSVISGSLASPTISDLQQSG